MNNETPPSEWIPLLLMIHYNNKINDTQRSIVPLEYTSFLSIDIRYHSLIAHVLFWGQNIFKVVQKMALLNYVPKQTILKEFTHSQWYQNCQLFEDWFYQIWQLIWNSDWKSEITSGRGEENTTKMTKIVFFRHYKNRDTSKTLEKRKKFFRILNDNLILILIL